ncbi:5'-nucleotidase, lipoprotein e(P4) family [Calditrichota bacterium LG25]
MRRIMIIFSGLLILLVSCQIKTKTNPNEHLVMATLYQQTAAEYRALCYQAFNLGRWQLQAMLDTLQSKKKPAVIVDIDETVLDNSPYEGYVIKTGRSYPAGWKEWVKAAQARPVPGALEFLTFADRQGVDIFYVSNRRAKNQVWTMENLKKVGFPQVTDDHMFLRTTTSSKKERRQAIQKTHVILLLFGDNLNDFASVFENKSIDDRFKAADEFRSQFGRRFIVLPNAMYGEWEGAIYNYNWGAKPAKKSQMRLNALRYFKMHDLQ